MAENNWRIITDTQRVLAFYNSIMHLSESADMSAIGLERRGALVAGVVYQGFNGRNIWAHIAAIPGKQWLNRAFLPACFAYPFSQCGVDRISLTVEDCNTASMRFVEHMGFRRETQITGASADGGDTLVYVMRKSDCRFIGKETT